MKGSLYFIKYLIKETLLSLLEFFRFFLFPKTWVYLTSIVYAMMKGLTILGFADYHRAEWVLILLVFALIWGEYERGDWRHEMKLKEVKPLEKDTQANTSSSKNLSDNTEKKM